MGGGLNKDFKQFIKSIFLISHDGLAIVDELGNILKYNEIFKETVSLNEEKSMNINDYIKNFRLVNVDEIFDTYNNVKISLNSTKLEIIDMNNYYIISIMEFHKDNLLSKMYESIVCTLSDGIEVIDTKGRFRIYNDGQGKVDGYSPKEVVGKNIKDLYNLDEETSILLEMQKTKKAIDNTRQIYYTNKGNKIDVVTSAFPLYHRNKLIGFAAIVRDYTQMQKLIDRNIEMEKKLVENLNDSKLSPFYTFSDIITKNKELLDVISFAKLASLNDSNVIIYGETGTGKELFAQSVHSASNRRNKPFMALNCAAIPETLLESLLFGTTKGAFTGSVDKAGLFEQADGGSLFLDEINSMPMLLQSKLLRILESKSVTRLGDNKSIPVDVRIISSFNQNPMEVVESGKFRNDLFFRLAVVYLSIPPLKNRIGDIDLLCSHFIEMYNDKLNKNVIDITEDVRKLFNSFHWKGNVRQLKNTIESSMNIISESSEYIGVEHLPKHILELEKVFVENTINISSKNKEEIKIKKEINKNDISIFDKLKIDEYNKMSENKMNINNNNNLNYNNSTNYKNQNNNAFDDKDNEMNIFEKIKMDEYNLIIKYINQTNGNIAQAAKLMGISRQKLHYKIKKYNIK